MITTLQYPANDDKMKYVFLRIVSVYKL